MHTATTIGARLWLCVFLFAAFVALASADTAAAEGVPPSLPALAYGDLTLLVGGVPHPSPAGTLVVAMVEGIQRGSLVTEEAGRYGGPGTQTKLPVEGEGLQGKTVEFFVSGSVEGHPFSGLAAGTMLYWGSGEVYEIHLTASLPAATSTPVPTAAPGATPVPMATSAPVPTATAAPPGQVTQVARQATAGETVSTAPSATSGLPVRASVRVTRPGPVTIAIYDAPTIPPPLGFQLLGHQVEISAPPGTSAQPLVLDFDVHASVLPPGERVDVLRDGAIVPDCSGVPGTASPDPCVAWRAPLPEGSLQIQVLTSQASTWNFAVSTRAEPAPEPTLTPEAAATADASPTPRATPVAPPPPAEPPPGGWSGPGVWMIGTLIVAVLAAQGFVLWNRAQRRTG